MKNISKIFLILFAGLLVAQCSTYKIKGDMSKNGVVNKTPKWYVDYNHETMFKYQEAATAVSPDMELAVKKATLLAKAKLVDRINGEMNNKTSINYTEKGASESMAGTVEAQDVIVNMIKETVLRTYSVDKKLTIYNTEKNNYRSFVLMKISKKDVDNIVTLVEDKNNKKLISKLKISNTSDKVLKQSER